MNQDTFSFLKDRMNSIRERVERDSHDSGTALLDLNIWLTALGLKGRLSLVEGLAFIRIIFNVDLKNLDIRAKKEPIAGGALADCRIDHHGNRRVVRCVFHYSILSISSS